MDIIIAALVILGAGKSAWNGWLKQAVLAPGRIQRMENQHKQIEEELNDVKDAVVGVAYSVEHESVRIRPESVEDDLLDETEGPGRYVESDPRFLRRGGGDDNT